MEPTSFVHQLSLGQTPRPGQEAVLTAASEKGRKQLNIKLPTGYGKTFTGYATFNLLRQAGVVDRLLLIAPTNAQVKQFVNNCEKDYKTAGLTGLRQVVDLRVYGDTAVKYNRKGSHIVYTTTPQALIQRTGGGVVRDLLSGGKWMIIVDEYHHYGEAKEWGKTVKTLPCEFLLAMSATPNRPNEDGAFGDPDVSVTYTRAVDEKAVKPLVGHSYVYRIDAIDESGDVLSYTTTELSDMAGSDDPAAIEKLRINKKLRWSPKYVSPLVSIPVERMIQQRIETGRQLRAIVGAMCVSHAELVCAQVASMFPELTVDWVGTGIDGRTDDENEKIINRFLKDERTDGALDILVHVGMAGEGLDSKLVSEVVHLNKAAINNSNLQENGRAARYLEAANGEPVVGHINFDSGSEFSAEGYVGSKIEAAMDAIPADEDDEDIKPREAPEAEQKPLPEEPAIILANVELEKIDSGSPEIVRMKKALAYAEGVKPDDEWMSAPTVEDRAVSIYKNMRHKEAAEFNEMSALAQWNDAVNGALTAVTGRALRALYGDARRDKGAAGDMKKRINGIKLKQIGKMDKSDVEIAKKHYAWLQRLDAIIIESGVPSWLF
jgi:superfamily II DNA or RNA helicase